MDNLITNIVPKKETNGEGPHWSFIFWLRHNGRQITMVYDTMSIN